MLEKPTMNSPDLPAGLAWPFTLPYRPVLVRERNVTT